MTAARAAAPPGPHHTDDTQPARTDDRITVLFVDDEPAALRAIERAMERTSYEVICAVGPGEALRVLKTRAVDVMVSDIDMPEISGLELAQITRRDHPQVVRMLLTGHATMEKALHAINEGEVARFFHKPFNAALFAEAMERFTEHILSLRSDNESGAHAARSAELKRWLESQFPGAEVVSRASGGELLIDVPSLLDQIDAAGVPALRDLLRREG
jgi:DNA-binding NtrC family response regulator